ncbi:MAG: ATP-dependent Clp protease adaptor ClpS [Salibacteraceae bacterium]
MSNETDIQEEVKTDKLHASRNSLILFNDEFNTFDFVIDSLIEVCEHDPIQAEQCTNIVHYNGKCDVKSGEKEKLVPFKKELLRRGLTAEIH